MKLAVIGSGTGIIRKKRRAPCFLLETEQQKLLFDCGWGCPKGLLENNVEACQLDHIFITHPHADHMANLIPILQSILITHDYFPQKARKKPLWLHGYKGFKKDYQKLKEVMFPEIRQPFPLKIFEYGKSKREFGSLTIQSTPVIHNTQFFGNTPIAFRVNTQKR